MKSYIACLNNIEVLPFDITFEANSYEEAYYKARYFLSEYFEHLSRWNMKDLSVFLIKEIETC